MALVLLKTFFTSVEAQLAQGYLGSEGVETYLFDVENAWDTYMRVAFPVRMMVNEDDLPRAQRLLEEVEKR